MGDQKVLKAPEPKPPLQQLKVITLHQLTLTHTLELVVVTPVLIMEEATMTPMTMVVPTMPTTPVSTMLTTYTLTTARTSPLRIYTLINSPTSNQSTPPYQPFGPPFHPQQNPAGPKGGDKGGQKGGQKGDQKGRQKAGRSNYDYYYGKLDCFLLILWRLLREYQCAD